MEFELENGKTVTRDYDWIKEKVLESYADTYFGDLLKGLSGSEYRVLLRGIEMMLDDLEFDYYDDVSNNYFYYLSIVEDEE